MINKPKVVFDTNVFISAIVFGGNPRTCLDLAREGKINLITSKAILLELSQKLATKFGWINLEIHEVIQGIGLFSKRAETKKKVDIITRDQADNRILESAFAGKADYILSGDKQHILPLRKFKGIYPSLVGLQPIGLSKQLREVYTRANSFASGIFILSCQEFLKKFLNKKH